MQKHPDERVLLRGNRFNVNAMELTGSDGETYVREVVRHPGAVVLLPLIDANTVVMIDNHRPTVEETLLELPAGTREPGEDAMATAGRELIEETGYRAGTLTEIQTFYSAPGICDEKMHLFVAQQLTEGDAAREAVERIENRIVTRSEIESLIAGGEIQDAKTLIGLMLYLRTPGDKLHV